jgi:hypothetical protein
MKNTPPIPNSIGKRRSITVITGAKRYFTIEDEVSCEQPVPEKETRKQIYLQKARFEDTGEIQYRFTYYMIGVKPGAKGRWVFGQYALFIPSEHLTCLLQEARKRKWEGI